jgi:hypothetical protein
MNRSSSVVTVLAGLVLLGGSTARAQNMESVRAQIPFDFRVGSTTLPAGQYSMSYDPSELPGVLKVRSQDGHHQAFVLTEVVSATNEARDAKLVFEHEGTSYALSRVLAPDSGLGLEVLGTHHAD